MVKHIRELKVESPVFEWLVVEVAPNNEGRVRNQVNTDRVGYSDSSKSLNLLADPGSDAESFGGVGEEMFFPQVGEEAGEDINLSVPVTGGPYLAEFGVKGLVELALDVGVVG